MSRTNKEAIDFYNDVEEAVITIFGGHDLAADYFDLHSNLDSLYRLAIEKYAKGWSAVRTASEWYADTVTNDEDRLGSRYDAAYCRYPRRRRRKKHKVSTPVAPVMGPEAVEALAFLQPILGGGW